MLPFTNMMAKKLTASEKKIADILLNYNKPFLLTMKELSELSGVSEPSVVRLYKKLGYNSYQELKVALVQAMYKENEMEKVFEDIEKKDSPKDVFDKVVTQSIFALDATKHSISEHSLKKASEIIANANRLFFFGNGASGIIAEDASHKFLRMGGTSTAVTDSHFQLITASHVNEQDVILAISHSGESLALLDVLKLAKKNGSYVIAITGFEDSSITQVADVLLFTKAKETEYRSDAMVSRIVQLSIIDSLYVNAALKRGKESIEAINHSRIAVAKQKK